MDSPAAGSPAGGGTPASSAPSSGQSVTTGGDSSPSVIDLTHDSLVRVPGQQNPVKYGDYYRGFQSQFTKKSQEAAALKQRYQALEEQHRQAQAALQRYEQSQRQQTRQAPGQALREKLAAQTYLNGEHASELLDFLQQQSGTYEQQLAQRDAALVLLTQQLVGMKQQLQGLSGRTSAADFNGKISKFVSDLGLPPEASDLAKEIYLAYEGDDLDAEFPTILKNRWSQIEKAITAAQKRKVEDARTRFLPGKGGQASPSRPLQDLAKKSARDIADELWPGMVDGEVTT